MTHDEYMEHARAVIGAFCEGQGDTGLVADRTGLTQQESFAIATELVRAGRLVGIGYVSPRNVDDQDVGIFKLPEEP